MFEELLLPIEKFSIQRNFGNSIYCHPQKLFLIENNNGIWEIEIGRKFKQTFYLGEIVNSVDDHDFKTLKQAHKFFLDTISPLVNDKDIQLLSQPLEKSKTNQFHDILADGWQKVQRESPIFLTGQSGKWKLETQNCLYKKPECIENIFELYFSTRRQALETLHKEISIHLNALYENLGKDDYLTFKRFYQSPQGNLYQVENIGWWIIFTYPHIDLSQIF